MSTHSATFDFTDSVVLVTGGATGIGGAITKAFLSAGATVTITGRRAEVLEDFVRDAGTDKVLAHPADVSRRSDVDALVADVVERSGRLDVVISNAAAFIPGDITDLADDDWEAMRSTNIDGLFYLLQATLPRLEETGGNFVAVSSVSGLAGDGGRPATTPPRAPSRTSSGPSPWTGGAAACVSTPSRPHSPTPRRLRQ